MDRGTAGMREPEGLEARFSYEPGDLLAASDATPTLAGWMRLYGLTSLLLVIGLLLLAAGWWLTALVALGLAAGLYRWSRSRQRRHVLGLWHNTPGLRAEVFCRLTGGVLTVDSGRGQRRHYRAKDIRRLRRRGRLWLLDLETGSMVILPRRAEGVDGLAEALRVLLRGEG